MDAETVCNIITIASLAVGIVSFYVNGPRMAFILAVARYPIAETVALINITVWANLTLI